MYCCVITVIYERLNSSVSADIVSATLPPVSRCFPCIAGDLARCADASTGGRGQRGRSAPPAMRQAVSCLRALSCSQRTGANRTAPAAIDTRPGATNKSETRPRYQRSTRRSGASM